MSIAKDIDEPLFTQLLDLAAAMIACGGDVNLVESSLERLGAAYGAVRVDAFVITSNMTVTMRGADGRVFSQTRRIHTAMANDFNKLERLHALCALCCEKRLDAAQVEERLESIRVSKPNRLAIYLGSILAASSFAAFFGSGVGDALVSALFAIIICVLSERVKPYCPNEIVFDFIASLVCGLGICACVRFVPGLHGDMIIIGDIMLLIPGIALTNSMRDMLAGDTVAGALRFMESLLWAGALALGFMVAIWAVRVNVDSGNEPIAFVQIAMALPASLGFALMFNLRPKYAVLASVGGLLTWAIYLLCGLGMEGVFFPCLIASAFAALYAQVLARVFRAPISIFYIVCEIPLIPGRGLYYTMGNAAQGNWEAMQSFGLMTIEFVLAIAFGIGAAWAASQIVYRYVKKNRG